MGCTFAPISSPSQTQTIYLHSTSWDSLSDRSRDSLSDRSRNSFRTDLGTDGGRLFITRYSVLLLHILRLVHLFFLFVLSHFNRLEAEMCHLEGIATEKTSGEKLFVINN